MRKLLFATASIAFGLMAACAAQAQAWPSKPVTLIVPFPPGGSTDLIARTLAPSLQAKLGGSFIIENKAGATGTVGGGLVKRAAPDGYTIFVSSLGPFVIAPHLIKSMPYDPLKDFDYITVAVQAPNVLAVPANSPHKTVADVIAFHKANPGKMTFASSGNGSSDHLTAELFWQTTGTSGSHIPYKGGAPAMADLLGGQVDATFMNINTGLPNIKGGKLRALAITSAKRSPLLPEVPTLKEIGVDGVDVQQWYAFFAPAKTPKAVIEQLNKALNQVLNDKEIIKRIEDHGADVETSTPEQLGALVKSELVKWRAVVQKAKLTAE